ncbi:hypothetical protein LS68_009040 [Helicobacter sp. MIT 05-5293]|uniref:hypothetical protein n=1 Tax=Helicobacter sp. MIT 05-5293 TaxID=1548149 RepID=UPI00051DFF5E|nr:hypothetical protein [Helicobacter sp. MIT 05-5293]TLD79974.1 hypothetical protein LS68_009040 [Helicobacter sp. MIT 05-5293]
MSKDISYFDTSSQKLWKSDLSCITLHQTPKKADITTLEAKNFIYDQYEIDKNDIDNADAAATSLIFAKAHQKGLFTSEKLSSYKNYTLHFTPKEHLYDDSQYMCEVLFFDTSLCKTSSHIITCDLFLPLACFWTNPSLQAMLVWIEGFLCYFQSQQLLEVFPLTSYEECMAKCAYIQDAYQQNTQSMCIYYLQYPSFLSESHTQSDKDDYLQWVYLGEFCRQTHLDSAQLKAYLAFHYYHIYTQGHHLPNFAPNKNRFKKPLAIASICAGILIIFLLPLFLTIQCHILESRIAHLNAQSQELFQTDENLSSYAQSAQELAYYQQQNASLISQIKNLHHWQQTYHQRLLLFQEVLKDIDNTHLTLQKVALFGTPETILIALDVSSTSQIHISHLLAHLNTPTQSALMYPPKDLQDSEQDNLVHSQILVIHNVI